MKWQIMAWLILVGKAEINLESEGVKMAYKCLECGHIFEEGEEKIIYEDRGEFWGEPCSEKMHVCPICEGAFEETVRCKKCRSEFLEDELYGGCCEQCIENEKYNFPLCYKFGEDDKIEISINGLLATLFDAHEIEAILCKHIEDNCPDIDCSVFIDGDRVWFGEKLAEEVKKNENAKS